MRKRIYTEEQRAKTRERVRAYKRTTAGRESTKRYEQSAKAMIARKQYLSRTVGERRTYRQKYRADRKATGELQAYLKMRRQIIRKEALIAIGGICICCGESEIGFLTIDHKNNDGHLDKRVSQRRKIVMDFRKGVIDRDKYQCICYNCDCGRALNGGICPHMRNDVKN